MAFKDDLQKLSVQVKERMNHISNEETTKQALIIPFIQILGFDVFNPLEVKPEYSADFGKKRGEKVDYALFKDNKAIIFIEAKSVNENLDNHDAQLSRYFNSTTEVKLAILTNGIEYRFFTDLNTNNVMDESPFLKVDLLNLRDLDIESIGNLRKETFDKESLITYAEELVYTSSLNDILRKLLVNPSDEFIRFIIKDFSQARITANVIDRFRPLVKKSISNAVLDIVSKGLYHEESSTISSQEIIEDEEKEVNETIKSKLEDKVKCTEIFKEELEGYKKIKEILEKNDRDISEVNYKNTTNYLSVYNKGTTKWIVRINFRANKKNIITKILTENAKKNYSNFQVEDAPKGMGESRIYISDINDLEKLENIIIEGYDLINKDKE